MPQTISIIGSTGSVGQQTLDVVRKFRKDFQITGLACYQNIELLGEQIKEFKPEMVAVFDEDRANQLKEKLASQPCINRTGKPEIFSGNDGWVKMAAHQNVSKIVFSSTGVSALEALYRAIESKKQIALANKEMIVEEGEKIMQKAKNFGVQIIPIDSEHSAIFQCLQGEDPESIEKIILTCSGGPFYGRKKHELGKVTIEEALNHPVWRMGPKISIDSATLMNKAFEIIEAKHLFNVSEDQIEVVIHPEGIVHSMVQFKDGSIKTQLGTPDMRTPITYALFYPKRIKTDWPRIDFAKTSKLTFLKPDFGIFEGPKLAINALKKGGRYPARLRFANDKAVEDFLCKKIPFSKIYEAIHREYNK